MTQSLAAPQYLAYGDKRPLNDARYYMDLVRSVEPIQVRETDNRGSEITYLSLSQIAKRFPPFRDGRPVHVATVTRWVVHGVRLRDGSRRRLAAIRAPGRWLVTVEAVDEFLAALTADRAGEPAPSLPQSPAARNRAAERELDRIGI